MPDLILMGITGEGKGKHLRELIEPIKNNFDRIIWGFHDPDYDLKDDGLKYLVDNAQVIDLKWCGRLDLSRNITMNYADLKTGDIVVLVDDLERIKPEFFDLLKKYGSQIFAQADVFLLHGKRFLFKYDENKFFAGNPHEGLQGGQRYAELTNIEPFSNSEDYFFNVRNEVRDTFHWVRHYYSYYSLGASNHILLGCEGKPELVQKRAIIRARFFEYLDKLEIERDIDDLVEYWRGGKLTPEMKAFINSEKILNDLYRFEILGEKDLTDSHDYENIKPL